MVTIALLAPLSVVFAAPTQQSINAKYLAGEPVKILIVPGHDEEFSGARFNGIREADRTLALAQKIARSFVGDSRVAITLARDFTGYLPDLDTFFTTGEKRIDRFIAQSKSRTQKAIKSGAITPEAQVPHSNAPTVVAKRLYAINLWATQQQYDLVLHVHFNDYGPRSAKGGEYGGYSVYVPEAGLLNAAEGKTFGAAIANKLWQTFYPSDMPSEIGKSDEQGMIEDFNLIAVGANRTLNVPSILVEYSYLYEPMASEAFFEASSDIMARATVLGIFDYITGMQTSEGNVVYNWKHPLREAKQKSVDALMLQLGLSEVGLYPPQGFTRPQCDFDGIYGKCTVAAVKEFQKLNNLTADGMVGPATLRILNLLFK